MDVDQNNSIENDDTAALRLEKLIHLLETDRLGYRLERFVADEREQLTRLLSGDNFSLNPVSGQNIDTLRRLQDYEAVILPYVEFFAVGCAYSKRNHISMWADFFEHVAVCNQPRNGFNDALRRFTFYPAWFFLYSAGLMTTVRQRFDIQHKLFLVDIPVTFGAEKPTILHSDSFEILSDTVQKTIPGREREYVPLLNHLYDTMRPIFKKYFLSEVKMADAFTRFEVFLATNYIYTGSTLYKDSVRLWAPAGRYWFLGLGVSPTIDKMVQEAHRDDEQWPPIAVGMFNGKVDVFADLADKVKSSASSRGRF